MLLKVVPEKAVINDANDGLIELYRVVRDSVEDLIADLKTHENTKEHYYDLRALDRDEDAFSELDPIKRASRFVFLNKTCYNGLFRVNTAGQFNVPFGSYKNPNIVNEDGLRALSAYFNENDVSINCGDFAKVLDSLPDDAFVYLDPPYDPLSTSASFTGYTAGGFDRVQQIRLREACDKLNSRGIRFLLSNSDTSFIREQYGNYAIDTVLANRHVNSRADGRGSVNEVLVRNFEIS